MNINRNSKKQTYIHVSADTRIRRSEDEESPLSESEYGGVGSGDALLSSGHASGEEISPEVHDNITPALDDIYFTETDFPMSMMGNANKSLASHGIHHTDSSAINVTGNETVHNVTNEICIKNSKSLH